MGEMSLLFANRTPEDVMLKSELDSLASVCPRFQVSYTVDEVPAGSAEWSGDAGQVSERHVSDALARLPSGRPDLVCICGPTGFNQSVKALLTDRLGYSRN